MTAAILHAGTRRLGARPSARCQLWQEPAPLAIVSASGTKRTTPETRSMSAIDPYQTFVLAVRVPLRKPVMGRELGEVYTHLRH